MKRVRCFCRFFFPSSLGFGEGGCCYTQLSGHYHAMTVFSRSKTKLPAGPRSKLCSIIAGSAFPVVSRCGVPLRLKYRPSIKTLDDILSTYRQSVCAKWLACARRDLLCSKRRKWHRRLTQRFSSPSALHLSPHLISSSSLSPSLPLLLSFSSLLLSLYLFSQSIIINNRFATPRRFPSRLC